MKRNKSVKAMLGCVLCEKFNTEHDAFWWEDGELWVWRSPIGYSEGDCERFWWHWCGEPYVSIDGNGNLIAVGRG